MPNNYAEVQQKLLKLSNRDAACCLFYVLGFMSTRDSWYDIANAVQAWFEDRALHSKSKGG